MNCYIAHLSIDVHCSLEQKKRSNFLFRPFFFYSFSHSYSLIHSHSLKLISVPGREHPWCSDQDSPATTWTETETSRSCSNSKSPLNPFRNRNRSTSHSRRTCAPMSKTSALCPEPRTPPITSHTDRTGPTKPSVLVVEILTGVVEFHWRFGVFFFFFFVVDWWWWLRVWLWLMVEWLWNCGWCCDYYYFFW